MAWVEVATQGWGQLVQPGTNHPLVNGKPSINTTVRSAASATATPIAAADWKSDKDGLLPGFVWDGTYVFVEPDGTSRQVEAVSGASLLERVPKGQVGVFIEDYGASPALADNTAFIQAAWNALPAKGGYLISGAGDYTITGDLNFDGKRSVTLIGQGGVNGGAEGPTRWKFTRTGTGRLLSMQGTHAFAIRQMQIIYTSTTFTGTLLGMNGIVSPDTPSQLGEIYDAVLGGINLSFSASVILDLDRHLEFSARRVHFVGGQVGVRGSNAAGSGSFSGPASFYDCVWNLIRVMPVQRPGQSYAFYSPTVEPLINAAGTLYEAAGFIDSIDTTTRGLAVYNPWCGDLPASARAGTWIRFSGGGFKLDGGYISTGVTGVEIAANSRGISGGGTRFEDLTNGIVIRTGCRTYSLSGYHFDSNVTNPVVEEERAPGVIRQRGALGEELVVRHTAPHVRAFHSVNQSIASGAFVALAFDSERWDSDAMHDTVTNNERLTVRTAGLYLLAAAVEWAANATGRRELILQINGATSIAYETIETESAGVIYKQAIATQYRLAVNDYVRVLVFQDSGVALNANAVGNYSPEFSMAWLSA